MTTLSVARPVAIDLFAGAGGMSLGVEQAGFSVAAAVEIDLLHAATHAYNFPDCVVIPRSVGLVTGKQLRALCPGRRVDLVVGGAPCQGFSTIGKRQLDDPRNSLVREFVRLVAETEASYFLFENVRGITLGEHRRFLDELVETMEQEGYEVRLPWRVLNAAHFGVPQDRQRLFLMGARRGLPLPAYPEPTHSAAGTPAKAGCLVGPSVADALDDLPDAETFEALWNDDEVAATLALPRSAYAREMRCLDAAAWHRGVMRVWDATRLTSSRRTDHTPLSRRRFEQTSGGCVEPVSRFFRLPAQGVSHTLRAGTDAGRGAFTSPRPIHHRHARCITVREMARLHGMPDWFRLHSTKWHGARQVGNAVPPPLARALATQIRCALGSDPPLDTSAQAMGNADLLRMDMTEAAAFWKCDMPTGKRTRR